MGHVDHLVIDPHCLGSSRGESSNNALYTRDFGFRWGEGTIDDIDLVQPTFNASYQVSETSIICDGSPPRWPLRP